MPGIGAPREYRNPTLARLRMWPLPAYPNVLVFYEPLDDEIRIIRILSGSRDVLALFME